MRLNFANVLAPLLLMIPVDIAFCADVGPISLTVPPRFEGPTSGGGDGGITVAWVKHHPDSDSGTLLQLTTYDAGPALNGISAAQRAEGAKKYLLDFVGGVRRRRQNFHLGDVESISLAGMPAARVRWTGLAGGLPTVGVMYCVLVGTTIVSLHTQDAGSDINTAMKVAMAAIESVNAR